MNNTEAMKELFAEFGIVATDEQIKDLTDSFENHLSCMADMQYEQHHGGHSSCSKCEAKDELLKEANKKIEVFTNSVKERRKCEKVWISGNEVRYSN